MSVESALSPIARRVASLRGWRRWGLAVALGVGGGFAMPPWYLLPLLVVGLVGLIWLIDDAANTTAPDRPRRRSFMDGLLWGLGYFSVGSLWIIEAFNVPPADFAALGPPIVGGLAIVLAVFIGLSCLAWTWLVQWRPSLGRSWRRVLLFAALIAAFEWLRGHVFTGYPWNPFGHAWAFAAVLLQPAAWVGVYGLSALTVALLALPAALIDTRIRVVGLVAGALVLPCLAAALRPYLVEPSISEAGQMLRLVQPNVPQGEKWLPEQRDAHVARLLRMSTLNRPAATRHVIWPETAVPFLLAQSPDYLREVATAAPPQGYLLVGAPRGAMTPEEARFVSPGNSQPIWNSLHVLDATGTVRATYDKLHLVPLGEYLPLRQYYAILADTIGRGSFEAGQARRTIRLTGLPPVAVIICYEVIFPGAVLDATDRPAWILNVTNDSWFGASSGPYQHLVSARLRAVEEGLPLVRVANTGISAVVDRFGRVETQLGMEKTGVIDHPLPPPGPPTFYARNGDAAFLLILLALLMPLAWRGRRF